MGTTLFTSQKNTLRRDPSSGTTKMAAPTTSAYSGSIYVTNLTIPHNLGYVPIFRYYYEPFNDGIIWPNLTTRSTGFATNPNNNVQTGPGIIGWADSTNLYLQLYYYLNTLGRTTPVYWVIYRDFAL